MKLFYAAPLLSGFGRLGLEPAGELEGVWVDGGGRLALRIGGLGRFRAPIPHEANGRTIWRFSWYGFAMDQNPFSKGLGLDLDTHIVRLCLARLNATYSKHRFSSVSGKVF